MGGMLLGSAMDNDGSYADVRSDRMHDTFEALLTRNFAFTGLSGRRWRLWRRRYGWRRVEGIAAPSFLRNSLLCQIVDPSVMCTTCNIESGRVG